MKTNPNGIRTESAWNPNAYIDTRYDTSLHDIENSKTNPLRLTSARGFWDWNQR